jgi:hypothetical protein
VQWAVNDNRIESPLSTSSTWSKSIPLRKAFDRRQALLEIDVLTAMSLGISLKDLIYAYSIHCTVFKVYEDDTFYDSKGELVFTCSKGLTGVGLDRPTWEKETSLEKIAQKNVTLFNDDGSLLQQSQFKTIKEMQSGYVEHIVEDDIMPDYRVAHGEFIINENGTEKRITCPCEDYPNPLPGPIKKVIRYYAPFDKCDREKDYEIAWAEFERRFKEEGQR